MRAFIFGTFNPPTKAHIQMGLKAKKVLGRNYKIFYVPTNDGYMRSWKGYKEGSIISGYTRIKLLKEALSPYSGFEVSGVEVDKVVDGRTYNTLDFLGDQDSVLCIGMDNVADMVKWYRYEDLIREYPLLIFRRGSYIISESVRKVLDKSPCYGVVDLGSDYADISSTLVRHHYINNNMEALKALVPENVFRYLEDNENVYF